MSVVYWGKLSKAYLESFWHPFVSGHEDAPLLLKGKHFSLRSIMTYFRAKGEQRVKVTFLPLLFSQSFNLKYKIRQGVIL